MYNLTIPMFVEYGVYGNGRGYEILIDIPQSTDRSFNCVGVIHPDTGEEMHTYNVFNKYHVVLDNFIKNFIRLLEMRQKQQAFML